MARRARKPTDTAKWTVLNAVVVLYALVPVLWIVSLSFKTSAGLSDGRFIPAEWTLENYAAIFRTGEFLRALLNSIGIALIATAIAVVLGTMAAYAIARLTFPGKRLLVGVSLLIAMFPQISLVTPLFNIERRIGLFDTWPGLIIPYITFALPLAIYTLSAFFREIPWEMEQAAQVDGATTWQAFRKVIVPLAAPGVFTTANHVMRPFTSRNSSWSRVTPFFLQKPSIAASGAPSGGPLASSLTASVASGRPRAISARRRGVAGSVAPSWRG